MFINFNPYGKKHYYRVHVNKLSKDDFFLKYQKKIISCLFYGNIKLSKSIKKCLLKMVQYRMISDLFLFAHLKRNSIRSSEKYLLHIVILITRL